jgi:hypothetical protein
MQRVYIHLDLGFASLYRASYGLGLPALFVISFRIADACG